MTSRPWWIAQYAAGALLAVTAIVGWIIPFPDDGSWAHLGFAPGVASLRFAVPVLALSLLVNALLMSVRSSPFAAPGERTLLLVQFAAIPVSFVLLLVPWPSGLRPWVDLVAGVLLLALPVLGLVVAVVEVANWRAPTRPPVPRR